MNIKTTKIFMLFILCLMPGFSFSQNAKIDSLTALLKGSKDTTQVVLLNQIAFEFWNFDVERAHNYAQEALRLSEELDYAKGIAWSNTNIGLYKYFVGEYDQALVCYTKALAAINDQPQLEIYSYTQSRMGNLYRLKGQYDSAIYYYKESLRNKALDESVSYASSCFNLGITFLEMGAYDSAKTYLIQSLNKREKIGIPVYIASSKLEIGRLYLELGDLDSASYYFDEVAKGNIDELPEIKIYYAIYNGELEQQKGNYSKAIESIKSSLTLLNDFNFEELRIKSLYLLGNIYSEIGEYDGALDNLLKAESQNSNFQNIKQQAQINFAIGYVYYFQKNIDKAREISLLALKQFKEIDLERNTAKTYNLLGLLELYEQNYQESVAYFDTGLRIYERLKYKKGIAAILFNKSYIFLEQGQVQNVIDIQLRALELEKEISNTRGIIISYNSLGDIYRQAGNLKEAEKYLLLAREMLNSYSSPPDEEENNLFLSQLHYANRDYKRAYDYLMLSKQYSDSVYSQTSLNKSLQLSAIHDLEKKELEIENLNKERQTKNNEILLKESQLNQQRLLIYIGAFVLIFFSFLSYFLVRTISKLRATQQELIKAEKRASMGILIAGLGHEINNPLNFIKGGLEGMRFSRTDWNEDQLRFLDAIDEGIKRTINILDILNQFQKKKNSKLEQCNMNIILKDTIHSLGEEISNTKKVTITRTDSQATITGYVDELKQLFKELISNSLQAITETGLVKVEIYSTADLCTIKIIDNGVGIDQENLSLLENPFFTTKDPNDGMGFGLYLVDYILSDHDGKIHFESVKGEGTTATIVLPKR